MIYEILVNGTITVENKVTQAQPNNAANKKVILKNWAPFTNCISRINNAQADDAHDIDGVMSRNNLIENSDNIQKNLEFYGNIVEINRL